MKLIGPYQVTERIGGGGMAEVFKGTKTGPDGFEKIVALKRILPPFQEHDAFLQMLSTEARLVIHLNHPNIVSVLDFFEADGAYVIVMEYVSGQNLKQIQTRVRNVEKTILWQQAVYVMAEILAGLEIAHKCIGPDGPLGIVHRDVSPQNILVSYDGLVKLTDFGIARADIEREETRTGILKGKLKYCSPEYLNSQEVSQRGDLFSCGVVLFELLYGYHPFFGENEIETMERIKRGDHEFPKDPTEVPSGVRDVLEKSLSANPDDRPNDAAEFRDKLLSLLEHAWLTSGRMKTAGWMHELYPEPKDRVHEPYEDTAPLGVSKARTEVSGSRSVSLRPFLLIIVLAVVGGWLWISRQESQSSLPRQLPQGTLNKVEGEKKSMVPKWPIEERRDPTTLKEVATPSHSTSIEPSKSTSKTGQKETARKSKSARADASPNSRDFGYLFVEGPSGSKVFINGVEKGQLPMTRMRLPVGVYVVHIVPKEQVGRSIRTSVEKGKTSEAQWGSSL